MALEPIVSLRNAIVDQTNKEGRFIERTKWEHFLASFTYNVGLDYSYNDSSPLFHPSIQLTNSG